MKRIKGEDVKLLTNTDGFTPIGNVVVNHLFQPKLNTFGAKVKIMFGRINGSTKEMYASFIKEATDEADKELSEKLSSLNADGVYNIHSDTRIQEVGGDVYILTTIQCIAMKEIQEENKND